MKSSLYRNIPFLLGIGLVMIFAMGCHSAQIGDKPGEEMNSAMSAQQKALNAEHKKRGEQ